MKDERNTRNEQETTAIGRFIEKYGWSIIVISIYIFSVLAALVFLALLVSLLVEKISMI